jgi:regulator of replication initiation timing
MKLVDYEKYYHSGSEFIIPRDEFEKIIEENQRLQLALKNSKLSHKNIFQKIKNQKEEIKRLYKQRDKFNKKYRYLVKENQRLKECDNDTYNTSQEIIKEFEKEKQRLNNVLNEIYEFVDWHYKDNKNFFKNKGIGLNYPECDYILKTINELKESDK